MKSVVPVAVIRRRLVQARQHYNRLRLLQYVGTLMAVAGGLWFALLFSVERSWLTSRSLYDTLVGIGTAVLLIGGFILVCVTTRRRRQAAFLAAAIEGARPKLQDRLNTLVFLEQPGNAQSRQNFSPAIAGQAAPALDGRAAAPLYPRAGSWMYFLVGLTCLAGAYEFETYYHPLRNLVSGSAEAAHVQPPTEAPFELDTKNTTETAGKGAWGEVRIVEPGRDQKLTKLDVVPLRIEMAARDPITTHAWVTSVNGDPEVVHPLDAAPEPCFAAYSVLLYLDELKVSDWDVVAYYARANTTKGNAYGSQIYFIEIRPFRDDLLKQLGGEGSSACKALDQLNALTAEQTRLLRETHRHEQMTYERPELQTEDRRKLAGAEGDLAVATDHVYGEIASGMEDTDVGSILSHLNTAQGHMTRGADALRSDVVSEGKSREQQALTELVATRKALMKKVTEGGGGGSGSSHNEEEPIADGNKSALKALQQVAEFRNQEKAVQAEVAKLAADEKALSNLPSGQYTKQSKALADQQREMSKRLDDLAAENPKLFAHSRAEVSKASAAMEAARQSLASQETYGAGTNLMHAADRLGDLNKSLNADNTERDMARAYAMKKAVDQSAQAFHAAEEKPDSINPGQADALAERARQSTRTLKDVSGQGFGPGLSDALSASKQADLHAALQRFQSGKGKGRSQAAAEARANLEGVSKAFDASRPQTVRQGQGQNPGQGQGRGAGGGVLDALLEKLQSLALQDENGHQLSTQSRDKERAELLGEMEEEIPKELGKTDAAMALLAEARQELTKKSGLPVDAEVLKHLQEKLENMQASASEKAEATSAADGTNVADASRAPASYRQRLQRYYETLSRAKP